MNIALIYDRVNTPYGGAEKLLLAFHQAFPQASLYTSIYDKNKAKWAKVFNNTDLATTHKNTNIQTSFLQKIPLIKPYHRLLLPLMPLAFESLDLSNFELIISITSAEAKGVLTKSGQLHLCYLLSPPRYLYSHQSAYLSSKKILQQPVIKYFVQKILKYIKRWDQVAIYRPDVIVPISQLVLARINQYYAHLQTTQPIYPAINVQAITIINKNKIPEKIQSLILEYQPFFLIVSRLVPYKKIDICLQACAELNKKLIVVGDGPERKKLEKKAKLLFRLNQHKIVFLGIQPQEIVNFLYNNCQAVLMPWEEDFGITALEANAGGKAVIINQKSGAAEVIQNKKHGIKIKSYTILNLKKALNNFELINFNPKVLQQNALKYDTNVFVKKIRLIVNQYWQAHQAKINRTILLK